MKIILKNIQRIIDVLFYYNYLYYTKPKQGESDSASSVIFAMAMTFSILVLGLTLTLSTLLEYDVGYWWLHCLPAIPVVIFTFKYFRKNDRYQKIIDNKPMFFKNHKLSVVLTVLFDIFIWGFFLIALPYWAREFRGL